MSYQISVECWREDDPFAAYDVIAVGGHRQPQPFRGVRPPLPLEADTPFEAVYAAVTEGGYWPLQFKAPSGRLTGKIPRLPPGPRGWWHQLHSPRDAPGTTPLTIGVIDEALPRQAPDSPLAHVENLGAAAWHGSSNTARAHRSLGNDHGTAVCSLLTARGSTVASTRAGFDGIVPQAKVLFCAAGSDSSERLDPRRLSAAIDLLVTDYECDIISCSAGDGDRPLPGIEVALEAAADAGVLCFVAAGNEGGTPRFPAKYRDCYPVAALGSIGLAPEHTVEAEDEQLSHTLNEELFLWHSSAQGANVAFLAAGVAVFHTDAAGATYAMTGTSAAAPIAAGTAALVLGKDQQFQLLTRNRGRVNHALSVLSSRSIKFAGAKFGLLVAP